MAMNMLPEAAKSLVEQFNRFYPVGSPVFLIKDLGEIEQTTIRWPAELGVNGPLVGLHSNPVKWRLDRVIPIPARIVAMGEALGRTNYELREATILEYIGFLLGKVGTGEVPAATFVIGDDREFGYDGRCFSIQVTVKELEAQSTEPDGVMLARFCGEPE